MPKRPCSLHGPNTSAEHQVITICSGIALEIVPIALTHGHGNEKHDSHSGIQRLVGTLQRMSTPHRCMHRSTCYLDKMMCYHLPHMTSEITPEKAARKPTSFFPGRTSSEMCISTRNNPHGALTQSDRHFPPILASQAWLIIISSS